MPKNDPSALKAKIQFDVSREGLASTFREAMTIHFRAHVPGTNINERTLIASDYLDTFGELAALLEALSAKKKRPTKALSAWTPVTYEEHFAQRGSGDKTLAVAAYRQAPAEIRCRFEEAVAELQAEALKLIGEVGKAAGGRSDRAMLCAEGAARLRLLIDEATAIANGEEPAERREREGPDEAARVAV